MSHSTYEDCSSSDLKIAYGFIGPLGTWRPVFWVPFGLDCIAITLVFFFYHPINQYIHEEGKSALAQVLELDFVGLLIWIAGIVLFLLGISFGGGKYPWYVYSVDPVEEGILIFVLRVSVGTLVPLILGFVLIVACGCYEYFAAPKYAFFPAILFKNFRGFVVLQVATFITGMLYYSLLVLWPTQVSTLYASSPVEIGWYASATGFGGVCCAPIWGYTQRRFHHSRWQLFLCLFLCTLFSGLMATVSLNSNGSSTAFVALAMGMTTGLSTLAISMIQCGVPHAYIGVATAIVTTVRAVGGAIATTIYVTILDNQLGVKIPKYAVPPLTAGGVAVSEIPAILTALSDSLDTSPALTSLPPKVLAAAVEGLKQAYVSSFRIVYLIAIAFGALATFISIFAADVDHLMTRELDIKLDEGAHIHSKKHTGVGHIIRDGQIDP